VRPALCSLALGATASSSTFDGGRLGIANNGDLLATRERIDEARGLARQAGVRPAAILGLRGTTGKPLGTLGEEQYGAEVSQTIETFRKRGKRVAVANFASIRLRPR
jgi:cobalt-zinc-cadmium efflux system outer membrane protein